jgi:uncharacterized protein YabE (DUF348 family)
MVNPFFTVALDDKIVTDPIATFDIAQGTIDVFVRDGDAIQIENGKPVTRRLTGKVSLVWSAAAIAKAALDTTPRV